MLVLGLALAALLATLKYRASASFLAVTLAGTSASNLVVKAIFQRVRPSLWQSLAPEYDYGFPSGHSMLSCAFALAVVLLVWKSDWATGWKWAATCVGAVFVAGVGLSRLYLGVHHPSDVLAGWSASVAWVALLHQGFHRRFDRALFWWRAVD